MFNNIQLSYIMAKREVKIKYSDSLIGYLWMFITPALYASAFLGVRYILSTNGVNLIESSINPILFAFIGVVIWQLSFESILSQINIISDNQGLLKATKIPISILFLSKFIVSIYEFIIRMILILLAILIIEPQIYETMFYTPIFGLLLLIVSHSIGILLSIFGTLIRDIPKMIQSLSLAGMISSPIFYDVEANSHPLIQKFIWFNPLAGVISCLRDSITNGSFYMFNQALVFSIIGIIIFIIVLHILKKILPILVERF